MMKTFRSSRLNNCLFFVVIITMAQSAVPGLAHAGAITLTNGTATFSQESGLHVDSAVNGVIAPGTLDGWAIRNNAFFETTSNQIAVWETLTDVDVSRMELTMYQLFGGKHTVGRFRFSVTSDDRSTFADGQNSNGDVTANWTVLTNPIVSNPDGVTLTALGDSSILASGSNPERVTYSVVYDTIPFLGITGLRLEVLKDASLPTSGPGRAGNGNFVLSELTVDGAAVPEPSAIGLLTFASVLLLTSRQRMKRAEMP